jgi:gliding motility-associated-like protein
VNSISVTATGGGTYAWDNGLGSSASATITTAGTYTVTVTSTNGCTDTESITLIGSTPPTSAIFTPSNATCGLPNGSIEVGVVTGGLSPYTYSIDGINYSSNNIFSNLTPALYTIRVRDANNCEFNANINLVNTNGPSAASISSTDATCTNADGSITIASVTGGTAPYQYSIDGTNYQLPNVLSSLVAGTYDVYIKDNNGCIFSTTAIVNSVCCPTSVQTAVVGTTCGLSNGSITFVSVTGGLAPYRYSIDGVAYTTNNLFGSLPGGTYTVYVKDANGCTLNTTVVVSPSSSPSDFTSNVISASCGLSNGSITVSNVVGGQAPYQYSLNGVSFQSSNIFADLSAAVYEVHISDINGCTYNEQVTIENTIQALTRNFSVTRCSGDSYTLPDGTVLTASGTYNYVAAGIGGCDTTVTVNLSIINEFAISQSISLCEGENFTLPNGTIVSAAGTYVSNLTSTAGCDSIITTAVAFSPVFNTSENIEICSGDNYTLPNGTTVTLPGTYTSLLQSIAGCDSTVTTTLSWFVPIPTTEIVDELCQGENLTLEDGTIVNEEGVYTVLLSSIHGCDSLVQHTVIVHPTYSTSFDATFCEGTNYILPDGTVVDSAGDYPILFSSIHGCDSLVTVYLEELPTYVTTTQVSICEGESYLLPNGTTVQNGGDYPIPFTSVNGCDSIAIYSITIIPDYEIFRQVILCTGETFTLPNGTIVDTEGLFIIDLQASTGCDSTITTEITIIPLLESFQTNTICEGTTFTLPDGITVSEAGTYLSNLVAISGCDSMVYTTIEVDPAIYVNIDPLEDTLTICLGDSVLLSAIGANTFDWTPDENVEPVGEGGIMAYPTSSTMYYLTGYAGTCSAYDSVYVIVNPIPDVQIIGEGEVLCEGDSMTLTAIGAESYLWNPDLDITCLECDEQMVSPENPQTYTVTGTLGICSAQASYDLGINIIPNASVSGDSAICIGNLALIQATGGDSFLWSTGDTTSYITASPGESLDISVIVSFGVCSDTANFHLEVYDAPSITVSNDTLIPLGGTATIWAEGAADYEWSPMEYLECGYCQYTTARPAETTIYCVTGVSEFGCRDTACLKIEVEEFCETFFIPNAFAPELGGNENNDVFKMYGEDCFDKVKLMVFDRWGAVVFETDNFEDSWDGNFRGKPLNSGVYVYYLEATLLNGKSFNKKGNVTLIR